MLRNLVKISIALAITLFLTQNALASAVGVFNFGQIMQQSAVAKSADSELQTRFGKQTQALDAEFATLQKDIADFQKQAAALSENARRDKAMTLETQSRAFEEKRTQLAQQLAPLQQSMEQQIRAMLQQACNNYAKAKKLDIIIDGTVAAFASSDADITAEIIAEMDKIWKSNGSKFK